MIPTDDPDSAIGLGILTGIRAGVACAAARLETHARVSGVPRLVRCPRRTGAPAARSSCDMNGPQGFGIPVRAVRRPYTMRHGNDSSVAVA